jgi:hypothetical protein
VVQTEKFSDFAGAGVCADLYEWERDVEWVYIDHWDYFATFLLNNGHHDNINRVLRPFHDQLLYVLANALRVIHPTRDIRHTTERMRDRIFGPYKYVTTSDLASFFKKQTRWLTSCATHTTETKESWAFICGLLTQRFLSPMN